MNRLFGSSRPRAPKATLDDAIATTENRSEVIEKKVDRLNNDLRKINEQMKKARTPSAKNLLKQKALRLLQQKKTYEQRLDQTKQQVFNMEQVSFTQNTIKDSIVTTEAMRSGVKEMRQNLKKLDIGAVDNLHDDMEEMMEMSNEVQEIFSRTHNMPEIDEDELEAEFEALGDAINEDDSFLDEAVDAPAAPDKVPRHTDSTPPAKDQVLDEFGLPNFE